MGEFLQNAGYIFEQLENQAIIDAQVAMLLSNDTPEIEGSLTQPTTHTSTQ